MAQTLTAGSVYLEASSNFLDVNSDYTLMFWFYTTSASGTAFTMSLCKGYSVPGTQSDSIELQNFGFGGTLFANFSTDFSGSISLVQGGISDSTWYHVAVTRNGTDCTLYVNGSYVDNGTHDASGRPAIDEQTILKDDAGGGGENCALEGFKSWNRVLSADEIVSEMKRTLPTNATSVAQMLPFVAGDSSGRDWAGVTAWSLTGSLASADGPGVQFRGGNSIVRVDLPAATGGTVTGTAAVTLPVPTMSAAGTSEHTGTAAGTLPVPTMSASGVASTAITGTSTPSLPVPTMSSSGTVTTEVTGTSAVSLPVLTASSSGTVTTEVTGTAAVSLPVLTTAASGIASTAITGTADVDLPLLTVDATGTHSGEVTGTAAMSLPLLSTNPGTDEEALGSVETATQLAYELIITDGSTVFASTEAVASNPGPHEVTLTLTAIVTVTETSTLTAKVATSDAAGAAMIASTVFNGTGKNASCISAVRLTSNE